MDRTQQGRGGRERGTTLLEVALAAAVLTMALLGVASAFGSNTAAVGKARGLTRAARFLEEVVDSTSAQPFENLTSLNGNILYSETTRAAARYRIRIDVSQAAVDLLQIRFILSDNASGNEITRLVTYRSKR